MVLLYWLYFVVLFHQASVKIDLQWKTTKNIKSQIPFQI